MDDERAKELSMIYQNIIMTTGLPWHTNFETNKDRQDYIAKTYNGATIKELLSIGIDPFM